ncbi:hypothetical protein LM184_26935, partial [Escherichia coli]|nr:hypothetical protein [Escherichia coli]
WSERRGPTEEWVIWNECENYVVVLSARRDYWLLKTAYVVTYDSKIRTSNKAEKGTWDIKKLNPTHIAMYRVRIALSTHGR